LTIKLKQKETMEGEDVQSPSRTPLSSKKSSRKLISGSDVPSSQVQEKKSARKQVKIVSQADEN
jgi:hypothetical protein